MIVLSWEMFLKYAADFLTISDKLGDSWTLQGTSDELGRKYLKKVITKNYFKNTRLESAQDNNSVVNNEEINQCFGILRWEYHVYYNPSYCVPVLCFNVWNETGRLLRLQEVWEQCCLIVQEPEELYSALTQQEHPILLRPFFIIHPCKTVEFLNIDEESNSDCNAIIRYISSIGPMINLDLDIGYAKH